MSDYDEHKMQTILMRWLMHEKHHDIAIPNSTVFFHWEADLVGITRAMYAHEFEIKVSKADYLRDCQKWYKHKGLSENGFFHHTYCAPNYFWYATCEGFEIEPPPYAGWIVVSKTSNWYAITTRKEAPRLHKNKVSPEKIVTAARLLSFRLASEYEAALSRQPALRMFGG